MAPRKGTKRQAANAAGNVLKKLRSLSTIKCPEEVDDVATTALTTVQWKMIQRCLKVCSAEDDGQLFQDQAVEMAGEILGVVKSKMEGQVARATEKVKAANLEQTASNERQLASRKKCEEFKQKMNSLNDMIEIDAEAEKAAKTRLGEAETVCRAKEAEVAGLLDKKAKLENIMKQAYEPLKNSRVSGRDELKTVNALGKVLSEYNIEETLIQSLKDTLRKEQETRGSFIFVEVEAQVSKRIDEMQAPIKAAERREAEAANAKSRAEAACTASADKLAASKRTFFQAFMAAEESVYLADEACTKEEEAKKAAAARAELAKSVLASFIDGPLQSFAELQNVLREA